MTSPQPHTFVSYVRADAATVDRLTGELESSGISVWVDRKDIQPGERWKSAIRKAIRSVDVLIACYSSNYESRDKSYMNEELTQAVEEIRARRTDRVWFIPVRFDDCTIPERPIGAGESIEDLQTIDLFPDFDAGVKRLVSAILTARRP